MQFLKELGLTEENFGCYNGGWCGSGGVLKSNCPSTGEVIASIHQTSEAELEACLQSMMAARKAWSVTPAPARGEIVRKIGMALRAKREALGSLISLEMGKILSEGIGEVQEFIDCCDMAAGMSRTIGGQVLHSERAGHTLLECWNPLGSVGIITAFNFPCAVLGWNLAISLICGNTNIWKGASTTPLVTIATMKIIATVLEENGVPAGVVTCVMGPGRTIGEKLLHDARLPLISFTGSSEIGVHVAETVHKRFGRTILELGGNNASIVMSDADQEMALRASVFGAVGTAGQRCTSLRRLLIQDTIYDDFVAKLVRAYKSIQPGDPLTPGTLLGPVHTPGAIKEYTEGLETIKGQGGTVLTGGRVYTERAGYYVEPTIVEVDSSHLPAVVSTELFVPILYVMKVSSFEHAVQLNNSVPQGLSSSIFTKDMQRVFQWMGPLGSDCGIVNVNCGTSGAEIGGAFGGHKATGAGTESGSDSWKQYMRRGTCTINYSNSLPLAQGVKFEVN